MIGVFLYEIFHKWSLKDLPIESIIVGLKSLTHFVVSLGVLLKLCAEYLVFRVHGVFNIEITLPNFSPFTFAKESTKGEVLKVIHQIGVEE